MTAEPMGDDREQQPERLDRWTQRREELRRRIRNCALEIMQNERAAILETEPVVARLRDLETRRKAIEADHREGLISTQERDREDREAKEEMAKARVELENVRKPFQERRLLEEEDKQKAEEELRILEARIERQRAREAA